MTTLGLVSHDDASLPFYLLILALFYIFFTLLGLLIITLFYRDADISKRRFVAVMLGFIPVGIIALGSLSRLTFIDVFLVVAIPLVIVWYAIKRGIIK